MRRACIVLLSLLCGACASLRQTPTTGNTATAQITNAQGQAVATANLVQVGDIVRIVIEAKGLPPGQHGVHVHEIGKCEVPAFTTAGGHFNPEMKQHGALNPQGSHAGDLPNITIGNDGAGRLETTTKQITLLDGPTSLFDADGSAIVVHAAPDDFRTDPTGNSGARIACGVVKKGDAGRK
jgi:superoxide dismutase, Cu-Zn family